uniref:zinc finger protein 771-like n=1 Tax=Semicossyphus pulcher TaxID=241346 RepID=UPI0037E73C1F
MWRLRSVRELISQRLSAAVEEIIDQLERSISECEEELELKHRSMMKSILKGQEGLQRATDVQRLIKEEQPEKERSPSLDQEDADPPHIKEEQDVWTSEEGGQGQPEEDMTEFSSSGVPVKSEDDDAEMSQLYHRQTEGSSETAPAGPEPHRVTDDQTSHSLEGGLNDLKVRTPHTDLNKAPVNSEEQNSDTKPFSCCKCGRRFGKKHHLQTHLRCHTGERPFSCSLCGKRFTQKGNLTQHLSVHTREKPCSCPVCGERFSQRGNLTQHMTVHTREKLCC